MGVTVAPDGPRRYRAPGDVDIGWRPAPAAPGLAYLEKRIGIAFCARREAAITSARYRGSLVIGTPEGRDGWVARVARWSSS
jgi:hypothetical protein